MFSCSVGSSIITHELAIGSGPLDIEITEARSEDAIAMAEIHLAARRAAMPYLARPYTDDETRSWFAGTVGARPGAWWVARHAGQIVGYMGIDGENLDHLYVLPGVQRRGVGTSLLCKAKTLSPQRLLLSVFQRNTDATTFYESRGFRVVGFTDGQNEENEPDVQYAWDGAS